MLAPSDDRPLNDVVPANQLPDFSLPFRGQHKRREPQVSASIVPPPEPPTFEKVTLQQLMDEVRRLSVQQQHILKEYQRFS